MTSNGAWILTEHYGTGESLESVESGGNQVMGIYPEFYNALKDATEVAVKEAKDGDVSGIEFEGVFKRNGYHRIYTKWLESNLDDEGEPPSFTRYSFRWMEFNTFYS